MSAFSGMDVDEVQALARDLHNQAADVEAITSYIDALVRRMPGIWHGQDADRFADWWNSQHRPALRSAHDAIEGLGRSATNNAKEQIRASSGGDVASSPVGHAPTKQVESSGGSTIVAGGSTPAGSPTAGASAVGAFVSHYQGHGVDTDKAYGNQCVDLFNLYNKEVVGGSQIGTPVTGGARDLYEAFPAAAAEFYDKIPPGQPAQPGDVAVWGATPSNQWGHVAMVISAEPTSLQVIQQNGFNPQGAAYVDAHSYDGLLGYLRPKKFAGQ